MANKRSTSELSRLEEVREEDLSARQKDPFPQLISSTSSPIFHQVYKEEEVTSTSHKITPKPIIKAQSSNYLNQFLSR